MIKNFVKVAYIGIWYTRPELKENSEDRIYRYMVYSEQESQEAVVLHLQLNPFPPPLLSIINPLRISGV